MAAFFAWGNVPNSFVVANGSLLDYENLPPEYEGKFKVNEWNAMQLSAFFTGPNGFHLAIKPNTDWSARGPQDMLPYLQVQNITTGPDGLVREGRGRPIYVAFVPGGIGWFIRYSSKQCLWGPGPQVFPSTWRLAVADLERNHARKDECIDFVAFGLYELLLIRFENGNSLMLLPDDPALRSRISTSLIKEVEERLKDGWTLGNRTSLCWFDTNRWFIEWKRGTDNIFRYNMGEGEKSIRDMERVTKVLSGEGNDAALVASHQNSQMIAAQGAMALAVGLNRSWNSWW
ncbi:hypothetical protein GGR51DRAFT_236133 [Nemania sp. FL0031]|nr:hypothetical protein GGR51DRAFT_236133 [Nemania sp. FL0031]